MNSAKLSNINKTKILMSREDKSKNRIQLSISGDFYNLIPQDQEL